MGTRERACARCSRRKRGRRDRASLVGALLASTLLVACEGEPEPPPAPPPVQVAFVTMEPRTVTITEELPGRVSAFRTAQVRARTSGIVLRRHFTGGEFVREGQVLFEIDPAPLRAAVDEARAALERAETGAELAVTEERRSRRLLRLGAIAQQEYDARAAEARASAAQVEQARAALRAAEVDLSYATVTAPIDGVVGLPLVTEGALVGQGDATPMAVVQQLDPVYVDLEQPAADLSTMRASGLAEGQPVIILAGEGSGAPALEGTLLFSDVSVDPGTGEVTLRVLVPNPDAVLLPGQYVRARVREAVRENALLVPQQAVQRLPDGRTQLVVLDASNNADRRNVELGPLVESEYVIDEGVSPGERVVVMGVEKVRPGVPLQPVPWQPSAEPPAVATTEP